MKDLFFLGFIYAILGLIYIAFEIVGNIKLNKERKEYLKKSSEYSLYLEGLIKK